MSDNINPIVGKSKVLEEQKRIEEEDKRRKRKEEVQKRIKRQKIKAYTMLASIITVIIVGVILIVIMLMPEDKQTEDDEEIYTRPVQEVIEYDIVKNELVSETIKLSDIKFKEEDYKYEKCDSEILGKLEDKLGENDIIDFIYENRKAYPEYALRTLGNYSETANFILKYPFEMKKEQLSVRKINTNEDKREVPLFIQWDDRWGYYPYGDDVIGLSGCGPVCLSMVMTALSGSSTYTPTYVSDFSMNYGYYLKGSGTKWNLYTEGVEKLGFSSKQIAKKEDEMKKALDEGKYLILSMSKGIFTQVGHFIVIYDYTEDGKFVVNDPNSMVRSNKTFAFLEFENQIKNIWAIGNK